MKSEGFILITAMVFLFVVSLLVLITSETNLLELKMSHFYGDQLISEEFAEQGLRQAELNIQQGTVADQSRSSVFHYQISLLKKDPCGMKTYLIVSIAHYHHAWIKRRSVYQCLKNPKEPVCEKEKTSQRVFWEMV